jgi:methyltransferase NSUN6
MLTHHILLLALLNHTIQNKKIIDAAKMDANTNLLKIDGFPPESFHRIILDPPCSAWGLRPKLAIVQTKIEQLQSVCSYQRQFIQSAIRLLRPGGIMTYSTCTIHTNENEIMVRYILDEYPIMELLPIHNTGIGGPGWFGYGLNEDECQYVRRFDPTDASVDDSIGFFVAKFRKRI